MIFGMGMDIDDRMPILGKSMSEVKGQGQKSTKKWFLQRLLVTGARFWSIQDQSVRWGTVGSMPTNFGNLPNVVERQGVPCRKVSQYWQIARVAGKVRNFSKVPGPKHRAIARCEVFLSMYITYNSVSIPTPWAVAGPHGQLASR